MPRRFKTDVLHTERDWITKLWNYNTSRWNT